MPDVIGILGGMGPAATADFYTKLVGLTAARRDQDHPQVIIWSDPTIPDRSEALLGRGLDPTDSMIRGAQTLARGGATLMAVPCSTAHAFAPAVAAAVGLPLVNMIDEVARHLQVHRPGVRRVGLLATTGTITAGLYQDSLGRVGITTEVPDPELQDRAVMSAIRAVKAGAPQSRTTPMLAPAVRALVDRGAQVLIAGCTEIPLALATDASPLELVDPTVLLAAAVLRRAGSTTVHPRPSDHVVAPHPQRTTEP